MNCLKCNSPLMPNDAFCPNCGAPAPTPQPAYEHNHAPAQKNNTGLTVAIIIISALIVCLIILIFTFVFTGKNATNTSKAETVHPAPVFTNAVGSSTRSYDVDSNGQIIYYYDDYAIDKNLATAWTPNRSTDSSPSITLYANGTQYVHGIRMTNGYCKSETTYTKNKRVAKVRISYSGGDIIKEFGADHYREMIDVPFGKVVQTDYITIQVLDTYYGEWNDIAISEIEVY